MAYSARRMHKEDINQVTGIDREAFPTMWPPINYYDELKNPLAHYIVIVDDGKIINNGDETVTPPTGIPWLVSRIRQLFNSEQTPGSVTTSSKQYYITGFAGFWAMADEAHIISLAVRKALYRCGIGELLLIATIDLATQLKTHIITLEVRASNQAAISLYNKYGFIQVGLRRGYYIDNKEDAILMSTEDITLTSFQARLQQLRAAYADKWRKPMPQVAS